MNLKVRLSIKMKWNSLKEVFILHRSWKRMHQKMRKVKFEKSGKVSLIYQDEQGCWRELQPGPPGAGTNDLREEIQGDQINMVVVF